MLLKSCKAGTGIDTGKCQLVTLIVMDVLRLHTSLAVTEQCIDEDRCWSVKGKAMHTGMLQIFLTRFKMHIFAAK